MKRVAIIIAVFLLISEPVLAVNSDTSSSASATTTAPAKIEELKERLATKVAELKQIQKKAIFGTIKYVSVSSATIETAVNEIKIDLTDNIKIVDIQKDKRTSLTPDDLVKGDTVTVFGDYDATIDLLQAKVIIRENPLPKRVSGIISDINKKEYTVTLNTPSGQTYIIDIENTTAMRSFDKNKGIVKGGFSKLIKGETVQVIGNAVPKTDNRISAARFLDLGILNASVPTPTQPKEASVSATSGTPTATPKPSPKK